MGNTSPEGVVARSFRMPSLCLFPPSSPSRNRTKEKKRRPKEGKKGRETKGAAAQKEDCAQLQNRVDCSGITRFLLSFPNPVRAKTACNGNRGPKREARFSLLAKRIYRRCTEGENQRALSLVAIVARWRKDARVRVASEGWEWRGLRAIPPALRHTSIPQGDSHGVNRETSSQRN